MRHETPSQADPLPAEWTVREGLLAFLKENGYSLEEYDAPRTSASVLGFRFSVPNTPKHRWAIMLHDLHHVATGYGTDAKGEGEISAWELRRGIRPLGIYVGSIVIAGTLLGLATAPLRTIAAWRVSGAGASLFALHTLTYDELLTRTIGELRGMLAIPSAGVSVRPRKAHSLAPPP